MKDNIHSSKIFNRKIIIEIRFEPKPKFFDMKGQIIESIVKKDIIKNSNWTIGDTIIKISDSTDVNEERDVFTLELNRLSFISSKIDSVDSYYKKFQAFYDTTKEIFNNSIPIVKRIGCRIQGTYSMNSNNYKSILGYFMKQFPNNILIDGFDINDLKFHIEYKGGFYAIGPINNNDKFLKENFHYIGYNDSVGFGIDTDNYINNSSEQNFFDLDKISNVLKASLSVEKSLFERFNEKFNEGK